MTNAFSIGFRYSLEDDVASKDTLFPTAYIDFFMPILLYMRQLEKSKRTLQICSRQGNQLSYKSCNADSFDFFSYSRPPTRIRCIPDSYLPNPLPTPITAHHFLSSIIHTYTHKHTHTHTPSTVHCTQYIFTLHIMHDTLYHSSLSYSLSKSQNSLSFDARNDMRKEE